MGNAIQAAKRAARKAIESTYEGLMTVSEYKAVKDPVTHITRNQEVIVLEDQPCKLSFERIAAAVQTETVATVSQAVKVFTSPDITIQPGSKLKITQKGVTTDYSLSGVPAIYDTHQEIVLKLFDTWS